MHIGNANWRCGVFLLAASVASVSAFAVPQVTYFQSSGYYKQQNRPTLYQPLNVLDTRSASAFCTSSWDTSKDVIVFGLSEAVEMTHVVVTNGNNFDARNFESFGRAKRLTIHSGQQTEDVALKDVRGQQRIQFQKPLRGMRFRLEIPEQFPAEDLESPVCLSDIVFYSGDAALNGADMTPMLKFDRAIAQLLGVWYAGFDKTPEQFLEFSFDGSFRYADDPFIPTRRAGKTIVGQYDPSGNRVAFTIAGKRIMADVRIDTTGKSKTLRFIGELPEALLQPFRSLP